MMEQGHITLLKLMERIKGVVHSSFAAPLWVSAEISQLQSHSSGHCYLELIEKGEGQSQPQAQVRATIWRSHYGAISAMFREQTGYDLVRGMKILARVGVTFHPSYGLSLQITDIDPTYTLGDMERVKRESIARLKSEGVWDMNRELPMPYVPQRVAVISSAGAAGYQDFCEQISSLPYKLYLTLFPATMQGESAEESIISALELIALSDDEFDVVAIIRGGGSVMDMNCFNSYSLCANVAQFPLPIITGIGHQRDESVADMVASTPLKTPTAVAVWLGERVQRVDEWLESAVDKVVDSSREMTLKAQSDLRGWGAELSLLSMKLLEAEREELTSQRTQLLHFSQTLLQGCGESLMRWQQEFVQWSAVLLETQKQRLSALSTQVELQSPDHILAMGYAIAQKGGRAITSVSDVSVGDSVTLRMKDGEVTTIVNYKSSNDK